jgi:lysophospholipase L1-like esterase
MRILCREDCTEVAKPRSRTGSREESRARRADQELDGAPTAPTAKRALAAKIVVYLLLLIAFEAALRFCFPLPELKNFGRVNYMPLALGFTNRNVNQIRNMNLVVESGPDGARFVHNLNAYGFRDREWKTAKPSGTTRFFFVGDSMLEGEMAEDDETIPAVYRQKAEEADLSYDVMNLGIMGADLESYFRLILDATPIFRPDYVFLFLFANDLAAQPGIPRTDFEPVYFKRYNPRLVELATAISRDEMPALRWHHVEHHFFKAAPHDFNPWSHREAELRRLVTPEMAGHIMAGKFNPYAVNDMAYQESFLKRSTRIDAELTFMKSFLADHGARLHVVYLPSRHQITNYYQQFSRAYCLRCPAEMDLTRPRYRRQATRLALACEKLNIPFIDLTPAMENEEARGRHLYWEYDGHMKGEGYRMVGELVFDRWQP